MNKKYWLRGGITGLIIGILIVLYIQLTAHSSGYGIQFQLKDIWIALVITIGGPIVGGFIVGSIIGWIYGKVKGNSNMVR